MMCIHTNFSLGPSADHRVFRYTEYIINDGVTCVFFKAISKIYPQKSQNLAGESKEDKKSTYLVTC